MWNLERWYRQTYLQGRNRDIDIEKEHVERGREGMDWEMEINMHTCVKQMASGNLLYSIESFPREVLWDDQGGWAGGVGGGRSKREGTYVYI